MVADCGWKPRHPPVFDAGILMSMASLQQSLNQLIGNYGNCAKETLIEAFSMLWGL
jgi:hypothetical protein